MEAAPPVELLGRSHLLTLAVLLGLALSIPLWARSWSRAAQRRFAILLAVGLVTYRTGWIFYRLWLHDDPLLPLLPLGICPLLYYLCASVLWKRTYAVYEVVYFWGIAGSLQAMLTPDVRYGFPHPEYFSLLVSHGALVLAVLYATLVFDLRPRPRSLLRVLWVTVAYATLLLPLNLLLGTNFMYLVEKPVGASLLDHLGSWPWYNLVGIGAAWVFFLLSYLPFLLADFAAGRQAAGLAVDLD